MSPRATVVCDLGFGDSGKGTLVDLLVRDGGAGLVIRWNGGAQAGHTVVTDDGRTHTFSQLGAGTFVPGVRSHLAETVVVHPTALLVEARVLAERTGVADALARLSIAEGARVTTPFHQAAGRLRELLRGPARHGSCGVGVGETVRDALEAGGDALRMGDLHDGGRARAKLGRAQERLRAALAGVPRGPASETAAARAERAVLDDDGAIAERWLERACPVAAHVVPDDALGPMLRAGPTVLEGAQGVLLDERVGFHPHTTWSDCTPGAALDLLRRHGHGGEVVRLGVLRTYATRHGEGPLPTEDAALRAHLPEPHNPDAGWQGAFRVGPLDLVLLRYAVAASGGLDGLALTHCDRIAATSTLALAYEGADDASLFVHDPHGRALSLRGGGLAHQARLGEALGRVRPVLVPVGGEPDLCRRLHAELGVPVRLTSHGPRARDKRWRR